MRIDVAKNFLGLISYKNREKLAEIPW